MTGTVIPSRTRGCYPSRIPFRKRAYLHHRVYYAGLWHDTPEETTAFYRENLGPKDWMGEGIHDAPLRVRRHSRASYLDGEGKQLFTRGPGYIGPPWIIAWDGRSPDQVKAILAKLP